MKKMEDIGEDILMRYFPKFLDVKMLKFVELKFKLEERLRELINFKRKPSQIARKRLKKSSFESIDKSLSKNEFWSHNVTAGQKMAREIKNSVKLNKLEEETTKEPFPCPLNSFNSSKLCFFGQKLKIF